MASDAGGIASCSKRSRPRHSRQLLQPPGSALGLAPACVLPLLIRRIGFQNSYRMTLTTETMTARQSLEAGLVDELADSLDDAIRRRSLRLTRSIRKP